MHNQTCLGFFSTFFCNFAWITWFSNVTRFLEALMFICIWLRSFAFYPWTGTWEENRP